VKPLYIFRHISCDKTGFLCHYLDAQEIPYKLICVSLGQSLVCDLNATSGLIFLGAPHSVNGPESWIGDEISLIRRAAAMKMPVMGVCFGGQLIAKALGGEVLTSEQMQIGWHPVTTTEKGRALMSCTGLPSGFHVFEWHEEGFALPEGATPLFSDNKGLNQGFVLGSCFAMQFHLEMTDELIEASLNRFADCLPPASLSIQSSEQILIDSPRYLTIMHQVAEAIYGWWLDEYVLRRSEFIPTRVPGNTAGSE